MNVTANATGISFGNSETDTILNFELEKGGTTAGSSNTTTFTNVSDLTITTGDTSIFNGITLDEDSTAGHGVNTTKFTLVK